MNTVCYNCGAIGDLLLKDGRAVCVPCFDVQRHLPQEIDRVITLAERDRAMGDHAVVDDLITLQAIRRKRGRGFEESRLDPAFVQRYIQRGYLVRKTDRPGLVFAPWHSWDRPGINVVLAKTDAVKNEVTQWDASPSLRWLLNQAIPDLLDYIRAIEHELAQTKDTERETV